MEKYKLLVITFKYDYNYGSENRLTLKESFAKKSL